MHVSTVELSVVLAVVARETEFCVFFFQAEDGIRYLVRSRGLGDLYKRQVNDRPVLVMVPRHQEHLEVGVRRDDGEDGLTLLPVSYTHLTLPTSDLV